MQRGSSSSFSLSKTAKKRSSSPTLSSSPPKEVCTRRKGTDWIDDQKKREMTLSKRIDGLFKKADALNKLTGAPVTVAVFSPKGEPKFFGRPLVEQIFSGYLCCEGDRKQLMCPNKWLDWAETECDSCKTQEVCVSLIKKCQVVLHLLLKKWKYLESNPSVNAGAGHESGVESGRDPGDLTVDGIHSMIKDLETSEPSLYNDIFKPFVVDCGDWAACGESSGVDSSSMSSDAEGCGMDLDDLVIPTSGGLP